MERHDETFRNYLKTPYGEFSPDVFVFLDGVDIRKLEGYNTPIDHVNTIHLLGIVSGIGGG